MEDEVDYESLKLTDLNTAWLDIDPRNCKFELDALQNEMLNFYLRNDQRFRIAFYTNWTPHFIQYMKDKARLREPIHLAVIGQTRSGKSYSSISVCVVHSLLNGRVFDEHYICANSYEFVEKLKEMPEEDLINSMFLIDEQKNSVYSAGSIARKTKILDVQNIIAMNNISSISLTPDKWSNEQASYGLRSFGRDFKNKICRFMIYNLSESSRTGLPLGMIYLPIFTNLLPEKFAKVLENKYLTKKKEWISAEMRGENDVVGLIHKKTAESLMRDDQFLGLKKKNERKIYIQQKLGSEWTGSEIEAVLQLTNMLRNGVKFD
jgi:hypothetical protein